MNAYEIREQLCTKGDDENARQYLSQLYKFSPNQLLILQAKAGVKLSADQLINAYTEPQLCLMFRQLAPYATIVRKTPIIQTGISRVPMFNLPSFQEMNEK